MWDFDEIYAEYFSEVYKFVLVLCRNHELAEEITQEAFFKALRSIEKFDGRSNIGSWLCKIAQNAYYDYQKKNKAKVNYTIELIPTDIDLAESFSDKETALEVHKALHKIKEPYREVFWLRTFGELSFLQIGALFDRSENWARVTYYRAKLLIKEELK